MAKIDTTKIEGYSAMSAEEKLAALEGYEFESPAKDNAEVEKLKSALSKANSAAADYKKQLRAKQTDDEAKAAEDAAERSKIMKELEELRSEKQVGAYKASFLELGYDAETAEANAKALNDGDFDKVFASHKQFAENLKKFVESGALDKQPNLSGGKPLGKENVEDASLSAFRSAAGLG